MQGINLKSLQVHTYISMLYIVLTAMLCKEYNGKNLKLSHSHKFEWQHYVRKKIDKNQKSKVSSVIFY